MRLYIVRHGQTKWNKEKRMQGWADSKLTELGRKQAKLLGESLENIEFNQVVSSPLGRTRETSKLVIGDRPVELIINDNFKEMGFGSWEGQDPEELKIKHPEVFRDLWTRADKYVPIDGESFEELQNRIIKGINQVIKDNPDGNVLIVTHGMVIQMLLLHMKGLPLNQLWHRQVVHPTSLTVIEVKDGKAEIIKEDDIGHLADIHS